MLHLFTASAWIAVCFLNNRRLTRATVLRLGRTVYPFLQAELFLPWDEDEFAERIDRTIDVFVREGLLKQVSEDEGGILSRSAGQTDEVFRIRAIGHSLQQAFERYYIAISVLVKNGAGTRFGGRTRRPVPARRATPVAAVRTGGAGILRPARCSAASSRRCASCAWCGRTNGKLMFDERLDAWAKDARIILGRELRHTIEKISPEAASKAAPVATEAPPAATDTPDAPQ